MRDELVITINFTLCDFDAKNVKFTNPKDIGEYKNSISVDFPTNEERKIEILKTRLNNLIKSFEIDLEDRKICIINTILAYQWKNIKKGGTKCQE